jgi:predicted metal-dependent hydrolase
MNDELEWIWKEVVCGIIEVQSRYFLEGLRKTAEFLSQDTACSTEVGTEHLPITSQRQPELGDFLW